jgi:arylsulfatase A
LKDHGRTSRREFIKSSAAALLAGGCGGLPAGVPGRPRPNFLLFLADDLGYGDLGCYGHPFMKTPCLDRLAEQGMLFTDFYAPAPICSPSRAAVLTGQFPYRLGVYHLAGGTVHLPGRQVTVAELLRNAGYRTFFAGKWHLGRLDGSHPTPGDHGFDHWFASEVNDGPRNPRNFIRNGRPVGELTGWNCDIIVDEASRWLNNRDRSRPFFMEICSHEPHNICDPPERYKAMYDTPPVRKLEKTLEYGRVARYPADNTAEQKRFYYGTVTQLDAAFGRLMQAMEESGAADNTVVVFTSDNGPEYPGGSTGWDRNRDLCGGTPGPLRGMKRHLYEGGIRVPGIVRWPARVAAGSVCAEAAGGIDLLPTFCELAGAAPPAGAAVDGLSIAPLLAGRGMNRTSPLCWNINYTSTPNMAMRAGDHVIVGFASPPDNGQTLMEWIKSSNLERFEMYDVRKDPGQRVELSAAQPARFERLASRMRRLWAELQIAGPVWEGYKGRIKPVQLPGA